MGRTKAGRGDRKREGGVAASSLDLEGAIRVGIMEHIGRVQGSVSDPDALVRVVARKVREFIGR